MSSMRGAWPAFGAWQARLTQGSVRLGETERDQAARALGEHFAAGRLDRDEHDSRLDRALTATTWNDLAPLFADLPDPAPRPSMRPQPVMPPPPPPRRTPPFLPLLLLLVGIAALVGWWVLWVGLGGYLLLSSRTHARNRAEMRTYGQRYAAARDGWDTADAPFPHRHHGHRGHHHGHGGWAG